MSSTPVKRKLSAILAADAVGYSRMMGANEEATLKTLSAHRAVIDGIIEFHDGRIVGTAGNSVLAEFGSPDAEGRLVLLGKGLSGRLSGHPGTPIRARFEGRFENDRYVGQGNWGRRGCSAKLAR